MTILRGIDDGKFFDLPEGDLKKYEVPANKVKEILASQDAGASGGDVEPYGWGWGYGYAPHFYYPRRRRRRHYYYDYDYDY